MSVREFVSLPPAAAEIVRGLIATQKSLPPKLFYDAVGSALFDRITELPEYYLTRLELEILRKRAREIVSAAGEEISIVELGSGSATKTCTLLEALARRQQRIAYCPVDVSPAALTEAEKRIHANLPSVEVLPVVADYTESMSFLRRIQGSKLVLYLGSSIGNFDPQPARELLRSLRKGLQPGDALLLGTDLIKDPSILVPAYDDSRGVTSEFNKNILVRLNREFGADFDVSRFRHLARWNAQHSRMEMHLQAMGKQRVNINSLDAILDFREDETIHTENSYKYDVQSARRLLWSARFRTSQSWFDERRWYAVHLAFAM